MSVTATVRLINPPTFHTDLALVLALATKNELVLQSVNTLAAEDSALDEIEVRLVGGELDAETFRQLAVAAVFCRCDWCGPDLEPIVDDAGQTGWTPED